MCPPPSRAPTVTRVPSQSGGTVSHQSGSTVSGPTVGIPTSPVPLFDKASALFLGAENGSAWGRPQASVTFYLTQKDRTFTLLYPGRKTADPSVVNLLKSLKNKATGRELIPAAR